MQRDPVADPVSPLPAAPRLRPRWPRHRGSRESRTADAVRRPDPRARGSPSCSATAFGAGRVVGIGVGQGDRHDAPATVGGHLERPIQGLPGRVARIHEHERGPTDEVRVDGLTWRRRRRPASRCGSHRRPQLRQPPRREDRAPDAPRSFRSRSRAPAASALSKSAATCRGRPPPSTRARRSADARPARGPRPRSGSPPRLPGTRRRRTGHRSASASMAASPTATAARADRSAGAGRALPRSPGRRPGPRASRDRAPTRSAAGVNVRQQHAHLFERLADRGDVRGQRRSRLKIPAEALRRSGRRHDRPRRQRRIPIRRVHAPTREHVHVRRERHRRRPMRQEDFKPARPGPHEDDGRRRPRSHRLRLGQGSLGAVLRVPPRR